MPTTRRDLTLAETAGDVYTVALRRRRALAMTDTGLRAMAALATIGLSSRPKMG
jgi:hypothetical protein